MTSPAPQIIGRYAIHEAIAAGGMASVHFARLVGPAGFARTVAVKRAHPHLVRDDNFALMFLDEARLAARIRHPNVVTTLDVLQTGQDLLLVMEYVHGESLWQLVRTMHERGERVPLGIAAAIVVDTLHGLHAAHEARDERGEPLHLVHRDVSPHNILVGVDGVTRLVDFGIAKAEGRLHSTRDSSVKGKFAYMAPEQARGEPVSRLSDTYAAAVVLWELVTGERLFAGKTEAETVHKCLVGRARRPSLLVPDLPRGLDAILEKGLSRDPAGRYATAREMALDIEATVQAVRPSEVGEWVKQMASDSLAERARMLEALESTASEEATATSAPATVATVAVASGPPPARRSRAAAWAMVGAAVVLGVGSGLLFVARRPPAAVPAAAVVATPSAPPVTATSAAVPSSPPAASSQGPSSPVSPALSVVVAPPTPSARPGRGPAAGRLGRTGRPPSCDPPYSIDSAGRQIFKPECMR